MLLRGAMDFFGCQHALRICCWSTRGKVVYLITPLLLPYLKPGVDWHPSASTFSDVLCNVNGRHRSPYPLLEGVEPPAEAIDRGFRPVKGDALPHPPILVSLSLPIFSAAVSFLNCC